MATGGDEGRVPVSKVTERLFGGFTEEKLYYIDVFFVCSSIRKNNFLVVSFFFLLQFLSLSLSLSLYYL